MNNANLRPKLQLQTVLENLDIAQNKEIKLIGNISMCKYQRGNLDLMLIKKLRKIKEFKEELTMLQVTFNSIKSQNKELNEELYNLHRLEILNKKKKKDHSDMQYDSLLAIQQSYKL